MPRPRKSKQGTEAQPDIPIFPDWILKLNREGQPRAQWAYGIVRRAIIEMAMPPGSSVNERQICAELGISRTPLREALLRLSDESLIKIEPNSGTFVTRIDLATVFEGHLIRRTLEREMVDLACKRMTSDAERDLDYNLHQQRHMVQMDDQRRFYELDEAFHEIITVTGASERVWRIIHSAKAQLDRVRRLAFPMPGHLETVLAEHEAIVIALKQRDPEKAVEAMEDHLGRVFDTIKLLIENKHEYLSEGAEKAYEEAVRLMRKS